MAGRVCKALIPVRGGCYFGKGDEIAVCTLGSMSLLRDISVSPIMDHVAVAGRLLSENKGIDQLLDSISHFPNLKKLVLCGKDVKGHLPGQSLIALHRNGLDSNRRIIGSRSPYPFIACPEPVILDFRDRIRIISVIGETSLVKISELVA